MARSPQLHASAQLPDSAHLRADGLSRAFADRRVLTDVSLVVSHGEVACLIGENGSGKSTLLRILAGLDEADTGSVTVPGEVGLFHQEPPFPVTSSIDEVLVDATRPVREMAAAVTAAGEALAAGVPGAAEDLASALAIAERHHAWELDHRVDRVVSGLGLATIDRSRRVDELSGGQVARLSLAWLLLRSPDTLLLDEPTNHLDDGGAALLAQMLAEWAGALLIASHDRAFIDDVATILIDLDPAPLPHAAVKGDQDSPGSGFGVTRFTGGFTAYLHHRRDERTRWAQQYRAEQEELKRLRTRVRDDQSVGHADRGPRTEARASKKFYADRNAKVVSRRVNDAATALARLEQSQVRRPPARLRFRGFAESRPGVGTAQRPGTQGSPWSVTAAAVGVTGRLAPTDLDLRPDTRLLITGPNGSGKSSLLQVLAGVLKPDAGSLTAPSRVRIGLLSQEPTRRDERRTVRDAYALAVDAEKVPLASLGLLAGRDFDRPVGALSVGQRRRLDLAIVLGDPPDLLLLDEPTNHLSVLLATELEVALDDYPGAVVIASHDRWLRAAWSGETLELEGIS